MPRLRSDKALRSFFGARTGGQDRPQDINTPQFLIDAILRVWPNGIEFDPCSNDTSIVPARNRCFENGPVSGLSIDWPDFTYVNPPYGTLKEWLAKAECMKEHMILCPVRTNRTWWCDAAGFTSCICWLKPFPFHGHKQAFPDPLAMLYYGVAMNSFIEAFRPHGILGLFDISIHDAS